MQFSEFEKEFVAPLEASVGPIHRDKDVRPFSKKEYYESIGKWDVALAKAVVAMAKEECNHFPKIKECKTFASRHLSMGTGGGYNRSESPWEQRDLRIREMVKEAVVGYMHSSSVASRAQSEGWASELERVVRNIAFIQAQVICDAPGVGWDHRAMAMDTIEDRGERAKKCMRYHVEKAKELIHPEIYLTSDQIDYLSRRAAA